MNKALTTSFLVFFLIAGSACGQTRDDALGAINRSESYISEMLDMNFSVSRANDTLVEAMNLFDAQELINQSGGKADFSLVVSKATEIGKIRNDALNAYDELLALEKTVDGLEGVNMTLIKSYLEEARYEFQSERYDDAQEKIDFTYEKISEQQALSTKIATMLDASTRNVTTILQNNWIYIASGAVVVVVVAVFCGGRIRRNRIKKKIKMLDLEKGVIKDLIRDTQKVYFDNGKISENVYKVRVKKFEELIRDIDRQIPMLRADLENRHRLLAR